MATDNDMESGLSPEIARLSALLAKDPRSKLFIPLAEEYMKSDMPEEAVMTLEDGLKVHPAYMSARVLLGKAHLVLGDMDKACEQFENVIKAVPDNLFALRKLGEIYLAQKRPDEALKNFRILAILSPKDEELDGIIGLLEAGEIPPSPLVIPEKKQAEAEAGEAPAGEPETAVPSQGAPLEKTGVEEPALQPEASEEEELEGAAPVYEIDEEPAGLEFAEEGEASQAAQEAGPGLGEDVPLPESETPSPFDIGAEVPFAGEQAEALEPEEAAGEPAGEGPSGELETGLPSEEEASEMPSGQGAGEELQEIFGSYKGEGHEALETPEREAGVYELEEPSELDLEEFGVKMQPSSAEPAAEPSIDMPFEVEVDSGAVPEDVLGAEEAGEESGLSFEEHIKAAEEAPEDMPFEMAVEEGAELGEGPLGVDEPFFVEEAAEEYGAEPEAEPFLAEYDLEAGEAAAGIEPAARETVSAQPEEALQEPIKTETLAEMYITQGFYDRAIGIYKEMIKEAPGDAVLRQKLEELYMLADMDSAKAASDKARIQAEEPPIEPADFVLGEGAEEAATEFPEPAPEAAGQAAKAEKAGGDVVERLETFLDNIRKRGRQ